MHIVENMDFILGLSRQSYPEGILGLGRAGKPLIWGIWWVFLTFTAHAQVNTEALRGPAREAGFYATLEGNFTLVAGNSDFVKTNGLARLDFVHGKYHGFLLGNYELGQQDGQSFIHNGFSHFRHVYEFAGSTAVEGFGQLEFNEFLLLRFRRLLGGGLRLGRPPRQADKTPLWKTYVGLGLMHELEKIDTSPISETSLFRGTSYVNFRIDFDTRFTGHAIVYYQPAVTDWEDYRILGQAGLLFHLTRGLALETRGKTRFDSEPPVGVRGYDFEMVNGFRISF